MNLRISDFNITINGITDKKTIDRFSDYTISDFDKTDLTINYIETDNIQLNKNEFTGPYKGWYYKDVECGFEIAKFADGVEYAISHITYNHNDRLANFKNWNISNLINVEVFYSIFFAISDLYSFFVIYENGVVFHSSAIVYNGVGICFSGKSGTGKSTHTNLWTTYLGAKILNDDSPTLRIIDDNVVAYGTPFAGSTGINLNMSVPLLGIVFLEQAKENSIKKLSASQALSHFFDETKKPITKNHINDLVNIFNKLYGAVPMYLLSCNMDKEAAFLVRDTLSLR